jgi:RNA polymerase sigma-70 factor (ECF subfamily)
VQDAFVVLLQKAASLLGAPPVNVAGFLFGTLRHKVLHALAREARTRAVEAAPKATSDTPDPLELLLRRTEQARVTALLVAHTSPLEQEVLARLLDDHDAATIAADLGITPGHVRVLRHRALAKLRLLLAQEAS